jgi:hypothetical protein
VHSKPEDNVRITLVNHGVPDRQADDVAAAVIHRLRAGGWRIEDGNYHFHYSDDH